MNKKKWLCKTVVYVLLCLIGFAAITIVVDPYFHYHKPLSGMSYRLYEQRYINNGIAKQFDYDAIIIGTSMVENFKTSEFDELFDANSVKLSFSGASYCEISQNLQRAFKYNDNIEQVLWCLDWTLLIKEADYQNYDDFPTYLYDDNVWNDINYLLNKNIMYHGTLTNLWMTLTDQPSTTFDEYSARYAETGYDVVMQGYERRERWAEDRNINEQERLWVEENIRENVLKVIEENPETTFYVFFPPYSVVRWDVWNREGLRSTYMDAAEIATELLLQYDNVKLFCFYENTELTTDLSNYKDTIHYSPEINSQILKWICDGKYQLTVDNYKEHMEKERAYYMNYDYDALFE